MNTKIEINLKLLKLATKYLEILQETLNLMQLIDKIAPPQFLFKKNREIRCKFLKAITSYIYSTVKCISAFYLNSFSEPESAKFRTIH